MNTRNTKTKLLIGLSLLTAVLGGCGDGFNETKLRQAVVDEFKTADVAKAHGEDYVFIVRTPDGAVWIAETMGKDAKVTAKAILFAAR